MVGCRIIRQLKEQAKSTEQERTTKTWLLPACLVVQVQTGCTFPFINSFNSWLQNEPVH